MISRTSILGFSKHKVGLLCTVALFLVSGSPSPGQPASDGFRVWVKTSPCSGRNDWVTVARENPGIGGTGVWFLADLILSPLSCTRPGGCGFAAANAEAAVVRASSRFFSYCCRDMSVLQNSRTSEFAVIRAGESAGFGWNQVKTGLCCEEAAALAGKPAMCDSEQANRGQVPGGRIRGRGQRPEFLGCFRDTKVFDLNGYPYATPDNSPQSCVASCRQRGFAYAGMQNGQSCLCGNNYGKYGPASNCDVKCTGDSGQNCGGFAANSVYSTGIPGPPGSGRVPQVQTGPPGFDPRAKPQPQFPPTYANGPDPRGNPQPPGAVPGRWVLTSVTVSPESRAGWTYTTQGTTARSTWGGIAVFQWSAPPAQFDGSGFSVSLNAQSTPESKGGGLAALLCVGAEGLTTTNPEDKLCAYPKAANGASASAQQNISYKPTGTTGDVVVRIEMMWGGVNYKYYYKRTQ